MKYQKPMEEDILDLPLRERILRELPYQRPDRSGTITVNPHRYKELAEKFRREQDRK